MEGQPYRLLVVAAEAVAGSELREQVGERIEGRQAEVLVVSPALTATGFKHVMGDVDEARDIAQRRLDESVDDLRGAGAKVSGTVGDSDPMLAIEDALRTFEADEILIATHPEEESAWLEGDLFDRARHTFKPPITHVTVERDDSGEEHVADVERAGKGVEESEGREVGGRSRNLPAFSGRDLGGLVVAVVGTIVLVVLAASCGHVEEGSGSDPSCGALIAIAGGVGLINAAHIVGLFLFESAGYRGGFARFFALLSLVITPIAIVVSLLIG